MDNTLIHGDCIEKMQELMTGSIDFCLVDPPYGTTKCRWDSIIPLKPMWNELNRIMKDNGAIVFTAVQPFTSVLINSNLKMFKYTWVYHKTTPTGHLNARKMPMRAHEDIVVFYDKQPTYNPQKTKGHTRKTTQKINQLKKNSGIYGNNITTFYDSTERYPISVQKFSTDKQRSKFHPTQKPLKLMKYLIKTYTNEGDVVLDFAMGSGTTGVAAKELHRNFIGIEIDKEFFDIAERRIKIASLF